MGRYKDLQIDQMNQQKPLYQVFTLEADGPDDCVWDIYSEHESLSEATKQMIHLEERGYEAKLFDPYVGKTYDSKGNEC